MSKGVVACVGLLAVAMTSAAQTNANTAQFRDGVEEVIVTARSIEDTLPLELARYGHDVAVVSAERIAVAGYVDASAALQHEVPGLFVSPGSGPFDYVDVSLQGSRTGDVLWLIDGVRISNRIFNDTSPDTLPAAMIERIEVLKGGESLYYGTQGVAGAINMVTRSFADEFGGQVSMQANSNDGYHAGGFLRGAAGEHKFVVYGSHNEGAGYRQYDHFEASATDRKRGYRVSNVGVKYGYDFTDRLRMDALYHHTEAKLDNNAAARTRRAYNDRDEDVVSLRVAWDASDAVQLTLKAYLHDWDTTYANLQNHPTTGELVVRTPPGTYWGYRDYGANGLLKFSPGGPLQYLAGYDYQNYKGRDDVFPIDGRTETVHAVFGQVRTDPNAFERLSAAAGARYNRATGGKNSTVWNVSGRYQLTDTLYVEGMAATSFLLPSAEQLYYLGELFDDYAGNPDLQPEESENLNLSVGGTLAAAAVRWQLTGFARDIDQLIAVDQSNPLYPNGRYENVAGTVEVRGVEASLNTTIADAVSLGGSYTYTRSRDAGSELQRARIPLRAAKGFVRYQPAHLLFELSATVNWVGDVYQSVGAFGRNNFGDYTTVNLAGRWSLDRARRHHVGVSVENAFDEEYATRLAQIDRDDGTGRVLVRRLGVPRTVSVSYFYEF